jgi:hypothetical protein
MYEYIYAYNFCFTLILSDQALWSSLQTIVLLSASCPSDVDHRSLLPQHSGGQIQLWQFLLELLDDDSNR